jgi:hypothetical protein
MAALPPALLGIPANHPLHDDVAARLTPHPLKTWLDPIRLVNGGPIGLPRTYVHCTAPVMAQTQFPAIARMAQNDPGWHYSEIATGHEAMLTAPDAVAKLLLDTIIPLRHLFARSHPTEATAQEQA